MTVAYPTLQDQKGWLRIRVNGIAAAAGIVGSVPNPEGVPIFIVDGHIHLITASALAVTVNIGIGASSIADYSDIVAAWPGNGAADTWWGVITKSATEVAEVSPGGLAWPAASFLTVTTAAQASPLMVFDLYLQYIRPETA